MRASRLAFLLAAISALLFAALGVGRDSLRTVRGDEGTYLAMAESLALDGDLEFAQEDRERLAGSEPGGRQTVILHAVDGRLAYSKPVLFALAGAPFVLLFGPIGLVVLNLLAFAFALVAGWAFLRRLGGPGDPSLTLVTWAGASVVPAYLVWSMSDSFQSSLALAGLVLALAASRPSDDLGRWDAFLEGRASAWLGGALLGAVVVQRWPGALLLAAAVAALVLGRRRRRAVGVVAGAALCIGLGLGASRGLLGTANPYRALRATFDESSGHPITDRDTTAVERFRELPATQTMGLAPKPRPVLSAYSTLYFWIGRHTGALVYFVPLFPFLWAAWRSRNAASRALVAGAGALAAFYLMWWPDNYFGGSTFLGNRYFLVAYPLALVALPRLPARRTLAVVWAFAAVVGLSAGLSVWRLEEPSRSSQSHAHAGIFRALPFESTARRIDGVADRYWMGDFLRFTDSFARVSETAVILEPGEPAAGMLLVTRPEVRSILVRVEGFVDDAELVVTAPGYGQVLPLEIEGRERRTLEVRLPPAWRRHAFWWDPQRPYEARALGLAIRGPSSRHRIVRLRYGGDAQLYLGAFDARFPEVGLPARVRAGARTVVPVRVRNMSPYPWLAEGPFPVGVTVRVRPEGGGAALSTASRGLDTKVDSGDLLETEIEAVWPAVPGRYRARVELWIAGVGLFSERSGAPLADEVVVVEPGGDDAP